MWREFAWVGVEAHEAVELRLEGVVPVVGDLDAGEEVFAC